MALGVQYQTCLSAVPIAQQYDFAGNRFGATAKRHGGEVCRMRVGGREMQSAA